MSDLIDYLENKIENLQKELNIQTKQAKLLANTRDIKNNNYVSEMIDKLEQNTFLDLFNNPINNKPTELKITISPNYMNDFQAKSFIVDTLSPEFLEALKNELINLLSKNAIKLNDMLLNKSFKKENVQDDYVFKVGDKVKVTSCGKQYDNTGFFKNVWVTPNMDNIVNNGITYNIIKVATTGIKLNTGNGDIPNYCFPKQSLTLVESASNKD